MHGISTSELLYFLIQRFWLLLLGLSVTIFASIFLKKDESEITNKDIAVPTRRGPNFWFMTLNKNGKILSILGILLIFIGTFVAVL